MKIRRLMVSLTREEYAALQRQADAERRFAEQQASYILARSLRYGEDPCAANTRTETTA